jgi:hypothetical protein
MPRFKIANELSAVLVETPPVRILLHAVIYKPMTAAEITANAAIRWPFIRRNRCALVHTLFDYALQCFSAHIKLSTEASDADFEKQSVALLAESFHHFRYSFRR